MRRFVSTLVIVGMAAVTTPALGGGEHCRRGATARAAGGDDRFVVHEWGTFTSVAGQSGVSLSWRPLEATPSDLPSFVYTMAEHRDGTRFPRRSKGQEEGTVRMETPVLYFYSAREREAEVSVGFPGGRITEWYPRARQVGPQGVAWGRFTIMPDTFPELLREEGESHYYPAREVDAAPLRVGSRDGVEHEKFLFYRGVGDFPLPLAARVDQGGVTLEATGKGAVGEVIVFERRGARWGYRTVTVGERAVRVQRPVMIERDLTPLLVTLGAQLVRRGLFERETLAMLKTWRDQWFEDGLRVFYLVPTAEVERVLPLTVTPAPDELVRVLVGRIELLAPEVKASIESVVDTVDPTAPATLGAARRILLERHGRFARPFVTQVFTATGDPRAAFLLAL